MGEYIRERRFFHSVPPETGYSVAGTMGAASNIYIQRRYLLRGLLAIFPRNSGSPFQYLFFLLPVPSLCCSPGPGSVSVPRVIWCSLKGGRVGRRQSGCL